eukprot:1158508-Pelagomonas_calceolata.AAC.33
MLSVVAFAQHQKYGTKTCSNHVPWGSNAAALTHSEASTVSSVCINQNVGPTCAQEEHQLREGHAATQAGQTPGAQQLTA